MADKHSPRAFRAAASQLRRRWARALSSSVSRLGLESLEPRVVLSTAIAGVSPIPPSRSFNFTITAAAPPTIDYVDDGDAGYTTQGTWGHSVEPGAGYFGDDHSYARGGHGADVATYTFTGLVPGIYRVSATWKGDTNRATDAPFTVYDGANLLGRFRINQQQQPNSRTDGASTYGDIGTAWTITGTTLVVTLTDDADFYVDSDAIRIERLSGVPAPQPDISVSINGDTQTSGQSIVNFAGTHPGTPVTRIITVKNIGQQTMHLGALDPLPDGFSLLSGYSNDTLAPGQSTSLTVLLNASLAGNYTGTLTIHSDDPDVPDFALGLQGLVTDSPAPVLGNFGDTLVSDSLGAATAMTVAPDGRIFVAEQDGTVRIIKNGALLSTPFMDLAVNTAGSRGLLGLAFDPDFVDNNYVYVYFTAPDSHDRVSRFTAVGDGVDPGSEYVVLDLDPADFNHLGGGIAFGADGKLYIGVGDNSTPANAQDMTTRFGKILRLNSDGTIPTDNPFYNTATGDNRAIFALGFHNPDNFAIQLGTGRFFANDIGDDNFEEINDIVAGGNYGWGTYEGPGAHAGFIEPIYAYARANGATAITGGTFYDPTTASFPASYASGYFFSDLGGGFIHFLDLSDNSVHDFAIGLVNPLSLAVDSDGSLLYLMRGALNDAGEVHRISFLNDTSAPTITIQPVDKSIGIGGSVTYTVVASSSTPLAYQWYRGTDPIGGATGPSLVVGPVSVANDQGAQFHVTVTNPHGSLDSDTVSLAVTQNLPPIASILTPVPAVTYAGGTTINFTGDGNDAEDGSLPDSAFTWSVDFYSNGSVNPVMTTTGVRGASFDIPSVTGFIGTNVFYRITLTVVDSINQTNTVFRDVLPQIGGIHLAANIPGVTLNLDGLAQPAPYSTTGVVGIVRSIAAPATITLPNGMVYNFTGWSDAGDISHNFTTQVGDTTYTANYTIADVQIVDDHEAGYTSVGNWGISFEPGKYVHSDHSYAIGGAGADIATYTFTGLAPGKYRISAAWHGDTNRATNSPFTIADGSTILATVRINQQQQPGSLIDQGFAYADLGGPYNVTSGTLTVKLSDDANQYVDADAIRIERIGGIASGPEIQVLDGAVDVATNSSIIDFGTTLPGAPKQKVFTITNTGNQPLTLGAIGAMPAGYVLVSGFGSTTLNAGESTSFTVALNTMTAATYTGVITFQNNDADEGTFNIGVTGVVIAAQTVQIVDDRDAGWTSTGNMGYSIEGGLYYGNDHSFAIGGAGANSAIYTFTNVAPGAYKISATWRGDTNRASNSPFLIMDGASTLGTVRINQQLQPHDFTDQGFGWANIGTTWNVTSGTLVVKLYDDSNGYIDADAIRIERVGNVVTGPEIQVLDGTTDLATGTAIVNFGSTPPGSPLNKTITVKNLGTADLHFGAIAALPNGFTLVNGFGATTLAPGASTTFTIKLNGATVGSYSGTFSFANDDADEGPFSFTISGAVAAAPAIQIIDDGNAGFSKVGNWGSSNESGYYGNDHSYATGGNGADVATYAFTGLAPGSYRVSATWRGDTNRANNAPFTISDGTNILGSVTINQQNQPGDLTDAGSNWGDLGTFSVVGNTLIVTLKDTSASGFYVDADAIRIERIGDIGAPPPAQTKFYVDDRGAGWTSVGNWGFSSESIYYNGGHSYAINGGGADVATYTFSNITPGQYRVSATWHGDSNRATNSPFTVYDGATTLGTVLLNQQLQPSGLSDKGFNWTDIGTFNIIGTTLIVTLNDNANQYVDADAIRIERIGDAVVGPHADITLAGAHLPAAGLDFGSTVPGTPVQKTLTVKNTGTATLNLGAFNTLPAGYSLAAGLGTATLAPGASTTFTIQLDAGSQSTFTGAISFNSNDASGAPISFAVTGVVNMPVVQTIQTIDDGNAGFTTVGNWGSSSESGRYVGDDHHYAANGAGADVAIYTFNNITPGIYKVSATWRADTNRAINTPFSVYDGTSLLGTARINQQFFPQTFIDAGFPYDNLGTTWTITGTTLVVKISDDVAAGFYVDADAIRIERVGNLVLGPEIQVLDGSTDVTSGSATVNVGSTLVGTPIQKTLTIKNIGTATLNLGTLAPLPAGFTLISGFGSTTIAPGSATTIVIRLDAAALGTSTGTLSFTNDDTDEGNFNFTITGSVVPPPPAPNAPTGLTPTPGNTQVTLLWNAATNANSYTVKYSTTSGGPYTTFITTSNVTATVTGLTNDTMYYFVVSDSGLGGDSATNSTETFAKPTAITVLDYSAGFTGATGLTINSPINAARIVGSDLLLTDGASSEATSVYATAQQNVTGFRTTFDFQMTGSWPLGEGFTFVIQRAGVNAVGADAGSLGYGNGQASGTGGIGNSIAIKFNLFDNGNGEGNNSTGLYTNGEFPGINNNINLGANGFDLRSYNHIHATITYDGAILDVHLQDYGYNNNAPGVTTDQVYNIDIPSVIGGNNAWVGFTGATGHETVVTQIHSWTFTSIPTAPKPPAAPTNPTATAGNGQVALQWSSSFNASSYTVKIGTAPGVYTSTQSVGGTSTTIVGLTNGVTYYFAVSASNGVGEGANSAEVSASPFALPAPGAPTGLTSSAGNALVLLNWTAVTGATSYNVKYSTTSGGPYTTFSNVTGTNVSVTPLTNETQYYFVVTAVGLGGEGANSIESSAKPSATAIPIDFSHGFAGATNSLIMNGPASIIGNDLVLSNDGVRGTTSSVYDATQQNVSTFNTSFDFQVTGTWPLGDGFTFVVRRLGPNALGTPGSGLGCGAASMSDPIVNGVQKGGIANSVAVKFDFYDSEGEGNNSTGLYENGASPTLPGAINLGATGFDLRSYNIIHCTMSYDGTTLTVTLQDMGYDGTDTNGPTNTQHYTVDIPTVIGGSTAWVGFTAATGHMTNNGHILNWTFNGA